MRAQGDDVLVRRLRVVLAGGRKISEVEEELRALAGAEGGGHLLMAQRRPPVGLGETEDLVVGLAGAEEIQLAHEVRRVHLLGGKAPVEGHVPFADERAATFEGAGGRQVVLDVARPAHLHHLEGGAPAVPLGLGWVLPEAHGRGPVEARAASWGDHERAVRVGERQPVLEVRHYAERPVLIIELAAQLERARMQDHGVIAGARQRLAIDVLEMGDMSGMEPRQFGGIDGGPHHAEESTS